jgi:hypothetical protein
MSELEAPFSKHEVWEVINQLPSDKAREPDGFTRKSYKVCWDIIKADVMAAISAVWGRKFDNFGCLNSTSITLIPKMDGAGNVKDFRPISLIHNFGKLVTKILHLDRPGGSMG